jgi:hypothetical protein
MKCTIDCVHCYLKQAVSCMTHAGVDVDTQHENIYRLMDYVKSFDRELSPAYNSSLVVLKTCELIGEPDPYRKAKQESNDMALGLYPELVEMLEKSDNRLKDALKICVAGNIIDLGINRGYDVDAALKHSIEAGFSVDHTERFAEMLENTDEILFLADNAGEIVFDRLLVEELNRMGKRVVYAVKAGPVLNDSTLEDTAYTGMDKVAEIVTNGSNFLGTCMTEVSDELKERFEKARLVIAKGQANFETLENEASAKGKVFFMLKIKCEEVGKVAGASFGDVVFFKR